MPRALHRTLLELGVSLDLADQLVDTWGQKGEGNEGGRKGEKGKGKWW